MKKKTWLTEHSEPDGGAKQKLKKQLAWMALLGTFLMGKVWDWLAQEMKTKEKKEDRKEIVVQPTTQVLADTLDVPRWPSREPDPIPDGKNDTTAGRDPEWDNDWDEEWEHEEWQAWTDEKEQWDGKWWIAVHGMLYGWTWVAWDYAEVCSDRWTLIAVVDMSHPQTWLGFTGIRLDDFHNDPDQPASRATVLNLHWNQKFWRFWLWVEWKYTFIDHLPQANWFSPDVVLSYTVDWWRAFEWMYAHKFKSWEDSDAFRLTVAKKVNDALKITWQWWYETWYAWHFYGRIIVDVDLWKWFWAQLSCIIKNGKLTPTSWVLYKF